MVGCNKGREEMELGVSGWVSCLRNKERDEKV